MLRLAPFAVRTHGCELDKNTFRKCVLAHLAPSFDAWPVCGFARRQHRHHVRVRCETGAGGAQIVGHQHVAMLAVKLLRRVGLKVARLHGESAQCLVRPLMLAGPSQNIRIRRELELDAAAPVLLDLVPGLLDRTEIADGRGHDGDVRVRETARHHIEHIPCGRDIDHIHADYTYTSSYAFESSKLYDFSVAGSTLTVTKTREPNTSLTIKSTDTRACTLTLQVPRQTLASLTVSTTNDNITLDGVSAQTAALTTDNGRIEVTNFNGTSLSGTTRNGKITLSGVTSQNVAATIQNSGTLKLENISANVCNAKVQNGSITGSVVGDSSAYGFDLTAGGGRIRVSDSNDRNFLLSGKDALQQNAGAPQKLSLATQNGDVDVEFVR